MEERTYALQNGLKADLIQEQLGKGIAEDGTAELDVVPQLGLLELFVELGDGKA